MDSALCFFYATVLQLQNVYTNSGVYPVKDEQLSHSDDVLHETIKLNMQINFFLILFSYYYYIISY